MVLLTLAFWTDISFMYRCVWMVLRLIVRTCMTMIKPKPGQMHQEEEAVDGTVKQGFN